MNSDRAFQELPIGLCRFDLDLRYVYINDWLANINGISAESHIGRKIEDILHHVAKHVTQTLRQVIDTGEPLIGGEVTAETPAQPGILRTFKHSYIPIKFDDGSTIGLSCVVEEITDLKNAEQKLHQSQKMEVVGQLTGGVAHDFNNLLAIMIGNAESLEQCSEIDDRARKNISEIIYAVDRGASLTNRLLAYSRQQVLSPKATDVTKMVDGLDDMLRRTLGETVDLRIGHAPDLWPATIDPHQFENALVNLAINARDAMLEGGTLTIEMANVILDEIYAERHEELRPGDYVKVAVSDTGSGMTPEVLEKVFEPFFTTKEVGEGSGLGLSMVYGFVKQSEGHITIDSELGTGTTVKLYLPRSREVAAKEDIEDGTQVVAPGTGRILLVEDDVRVRDIAASILCGKNYEVVVAGNGGEAVKQLMNGQPFDLLFTDIVLPGGMNGVEIAEVAKRLQPNIKVLYASGYAENAVVRDGKLDAGVTLLTKPYRTAELLEKVSATLDQGNG